MDITPELDLQAIIKGCKRQDRLSQQQLYQLFYAYGMSICVRYAKDESEALLVLNDGFLKAFKHLRRFDEAKPFKPWFRKILVNTAINFVRRQQKFKNTIAMEEETNVFSSEDVLSRINYQELIQMVQSLSSAYRTVFNMYVIDGFKHEEIARELGISVGTSKSNLFKARGKLQEMIINNLKIKHV